MNFNKIYKITYQSDRYGGNHFIGLTIEFVNLTKHTDNEDNVNWSWDLIVDNKDEVYVWSDEDTKGRRYDGGCYYLEKDEANNKTLGEPVKDPELADEIREYIKKEWPLPKREDYIRIKELKQQINKDTTKAFEELIDEL
jgi:hypothetical protein